jgi:PAS domain S-box-containing protein
MVLITCLFSSRFMKTGNDILLKVNISFSILFLLFFAISLSRYIISLFAKYIVSFIHLSIIVYFAFLIFFNINYVFVVIILVFLFSYFLQRFRQLIYFGTLTAVLLTVIFVYSDISFVNKINLLLFVLAYNLTALMYLNKNIKISEELSFNDILLKSIYEEISEGLMIVDLNKEIIVKHNTRLGALFDAPEGKLIGKNGYNFFAKALEEFKLNVPNFHTVWNGQFPFTTYTGKKFFGEITISSIEVERRQYLVVKITDVSEKKQKEETIEKLSLALKQNPGIIIIFDSEGLVEYINPKFSEITGFSYSEIIGVRILNLGFKLSEPIQKILVKIKLGHIWEGEAQSFSKKGELIIAKTIINPVLGENNIIERFVLVAEDITKQKLAERAVLEAEHKYKAILQTIPDLMFVINQQGIFTDYKSENLDELYVPPEKIIGGNIRDVGLPESVVDLTLERLDKVLVGGSKSEIFEYELHFPDGDKYFECRMIALNADEVLCIVRNITKRKTAEKNVLESQKNYKNLVEYSPNGIILHKGKEVFYANKTALTILGYSTFEQMQNVTIDDLILPENKQLVKDRWDKVKNGEEVPFIEMTIRSPFDGRLIEIETMPSMLQYYNEEVFQIVFREISVQKRLIHEKLRAQIAEETAEELKKEMQVRKIAEEELKKSLAEKEVLLKEVHHRVKNNLQIISSILNLQANSINNEEIRNLFEDSQDRIKSMALVHENLYKTKDFSKIDFEIYVSSLVHNLCRSYGAEENNIQCKLDLEKVYLSIDIAIPCGLIINELVSNSLKHAFANSNKGVIFVQLKQSGREISIVIADNGKGMKKALDPLNTQSLGLQLVYALIEQIDGKIAQESVKGTKFIINFTV